MVLYLGEKTATCPKTRAVFNTIIIRRVPFNSYILAGAPELFTGAPLLGACPTSPLILRTLVGVLIALDVIVTLLLIGPGLLVSYFTLILALAPGAIGSLGQVGTVQPQDPFAFEMIRGSLPVFLNSNEQ